MSISLFEERLKNTKFIVQADSFAQLMLWKEYSPKFDWKGYIR
jgi:hypothetical protein